MKSASGGKQLKLDYFTAKAASGAAFAV